MTNNKLALGNYSFRNAALVTPLIHAYVDESKLINRTAGRTKLRVVSKNHKYSLIFKSIKKTIPFYWKFSSYGRLKVSTPIFRPLELRYSNQ